MDKNGYFWSDFELSMGQVSIYLSISLSLSIYLSTYLSLYLSLHIESTSMTVIYTSHMCHISVYHIQHVILSSFASRLFLSMIWASPPQGSCARGVGFSNLVRSFPVVGKITFESTWKHNLLAQWQMVGEWLVNGWYMVGKWLNGRRTVGKWLVI